MEVVSWILFGLVFLIQWFLCSQLRRLRGEIETLREWSEGEMSHIAEQVELLRQSLERNESVVGSAVELIAGLNARLEALEKEVDPSAAEKIAAVRAVFEAQSERLALALSTVPPLPVDPPADPPADPPVDLA